MTCTLTAFSRYAPATSLTSDLCPPPDHLSHQLSSPSSFCGDRGLSPQKGHIWAYLPFYPPLRLGVRMGVLRGKAGLELLSSPQADPKGREDLGPPHCSHMSSEAVVFISLSPQGTLCTGDHV